MVLTILRSSRSLKNAIAGPSSSITTTIRRTFSTNKIILSSNSEEKIIMNKYSRTVTQNKTQGASQVSF